MPTCRIFRFFFRDRGKRPIIKRGLTLDQVRAHCNGPETSSTTCMNPRGVEGSRHFGQWFDGYEEER